MFKIICGYGILEHLVNALKDMYSNTKVKVINPDGETKPFR